MNLPVILVNFKAYESAVGENALNLAKIHEKVAQETGVSIGVCVQHMDLYRIAKEVSIPVFAQHIDPINFGSGTGLVLPELAKEAGAFGTLINHAEHQVPDEVLEKAIARAKEVGLYTVVCANTPEKAAEILKFNPDLIAVEPPELIGGDVSVTTQPEIIEKSVELIGEDKLLVGAGVKTGEDVANALKLKSKGVLLASGITKADDPQQVLVDLASAMVNN